MVSMRLAISLFALTNTNKLSGAVAGEAIGVKILILTMMSTNLVYHQLLQDYPCPIECGINRAKSTIRPSGLFLQENHQEPRAPGHSWIINTFTLPSHRYVYIYISNHVQMEKRSPSRGDKIIICDGTKALHHSQLHLKLWVTMKSIKVCENQSFHFILTIPCLLES